MGAVIKSLEPYSGPYAVSTTDLELPIPAPRRRQFPLPTLKHSKGEPAFKLETVLFTLFYPADETRPGSGHSQPWVQRPIDVTAAGYSRFLGQREDLCRWMFKLAGESLQLPAEADRPLAPPPSPPPTSTAPPSSSSADRIRTETSERGAFPLIIFSHGMSGQRTTYSRWCGDMASHGFIVAALEHRDGSGPISIVRLDDKGLERTVDFLRFEQVEWPAEYGPVHQLDFRALQQQLRVSEVAAALEVLNRINDGEGAAVACENRRTDLGGKEVVGRYLPEWKGRIDFANVTMAGHSFGGGTTLEALRVGAPLFPFTAGIALDPSADPTPPRESHTVFTALRNDLSKARDGQGDPDATHRSGESDAAEHTGASSSSSPARGGENANSVKQAGIAVPLLVINSESFTLWSERFEEIKTAVKSLKKGARGWLMTLVGSEHSSFSDVFLVVPLAAKLVGARASPFLILDRTVQACLEFLSHRHDDGPILSQAVEDPRDEDGARPGEADKGWFGQKKGMAGEPGSMRMHLKR